MNRDNIMTCNIKFLRMSTRTCISIIKDKLITVNLNAIYPIRNDGPDLFCPITNDGHGENPKHVYLTSLAHFKYVRLSMIDVAQYGHVWSYKLATP